MGRSAKFELILTTRCQYQGVDLLADLPNLNSSSPLDVSTGWVDLPADLPNLNSSSPLHVSKGGIDLPVDLPNLNSFTFHALLHRRSFCITYERPNND